MFGLGGTEVITLVVVALILINPKELPAILRRAGRIYGSVMKQVNGLRKTYGQFEREVKSMEHLSHGDTKIETLKEIENDRNN